MGIDDDRDEDKKATTIGITMTATTTVEDLEILPSCRKVVLLA